MGLILAPDEIKTNMEVLRSYLNSMTECYQNVLERVYEYYDEEDLDTESFRESKNQMAICYRACCHTNQSPKVPGLFRG